MEKLLSLAYLETLSSQDLISLADDYGIDIPDNLNRRFIIGELLEYAQELEAEEEDDDIEMTEDDTVEVSVEKPVELPLSYNETNICVILRNPAFAYVYWDISEADLKKLSINPDFVSLNLRVSFFDDTESNSPEETFDLSLKMDDRSQYVLLNPERNFVRIDLFAKFSNKTEDNLCVSEKIEIPHGCKLMNEFVPGKEPEISKAVELSGMKDLLLKHYENHRQSFQ